MATIDEALFEEMVADSGIDALVSTKIYPGIPPQTTKAPFISFREISFERLEGMSGPIALHRPRIQIDCWGSTAEEAKEVSEAVRTLLDGFSGTMGTTNTLTVRRCAYVNANDDPEKPPDGGDLDIHRKRVDIDIWHRV